MRNRKASLSIETMVVIVLVLFVLLLLILGFYRTFISFLFGINSCEAKGGTCMSGCGDLEAIPAGDAGCEKEHPEKDLVCCRIKEEAARGIGANTEFITVYFKDEKTPLFYGERKDLEIGEDTKITVELDTEGLKAVNQGKEPKACAVFLKDTNTDDEFWPDNNKYFEFSPGSDSNNLPANKAIGTRCGGTFTIKPSEAQARRTYDFRIIVFNQSKKSILKDNGESGEGADRLPLPEKWIAEFTVQLRIKPIIEVTGLSTVWTASDEFVVKANKPYKLLNVSIAIVSEDENVAGCNNKKSVYENLNCICKNIDSKHYYDSIHKITNTKSGNEGFNMIFKWGHKAYQTKRYESRAEDIEIDYDKDLARVYLDASSISETFKTSETDTRMNDLLLEKQEKTKEYYVCAKAGVLRPAGDKKTFTSFSEYPLRLDVAPPLISNSDDYIELHYPDSKKTIIEELEKQARISPGDYVTPYYYEIYPRLVIKNCYDKSGCQNYDYFFAPTRISIKMNTADLEQGAIGALLGFGLNYLYNTIATQNPLTTLCPLPDSGRYRHNTQPEIRFRKENQGVYCIKAVDGAGNYWLTWKPVYNPLSVVEKIIQSGASQVQDPGNIVPMTD